MSRKLTPAYDLVIVGSGVAGLYGALCAAAEARVLIVSQGPGAHLVELARAGRRRRGDRPPATRRSSTRSDTLAAGRGLCRESAVKRADDRGAGADRRPPRPRRPLRRRARARGRSRPPPRPQRRRRADRTRDLRGARAGRARAPAHRRQRARAGSSCGRRRTDDAWASSRTGARCARGRCCSQPVAIPRSGVARRSSGLGRRGHLDGFPRRRIGGRSRVRAVPSAALAGSTLLLTEALRGDGALLLDERGDRFVEELAPRDVVARAIARGDGDARSSSGRPVALSGAEDRLSDAASSRGGAGARRPRCALHDGRDRDRPRARPTSPGSTRPASAHAPVSTAPPAGVELDARVPRLRPPRSSGRPRGAGAFRPCDTVSLGRKAGSSRAARAARRPKTRHSSIEFDASRLAPWTPVHAHSPAA